MLAAIVAAGLCCRLPGMTRGLGQDELFTAVQFVDVPSWRRTLFSNVAFNNHIGYSAMARASEVLFGRSEWALRLPALVLGIGAIPAFFVLTRSLLGAPAGVLAALLLALHPAHIHWSVDARGYSALVFFSIVSTLFYLRMLRGGTARDAVLYALAAAAGLYVHLYGFWVVAVQVACVLWRRPLRLRILAVAFLAAIAAAAVLYVPVFWMNLGDLIGRGRSVFDPAFPWKVLQFLSGAASPWVAGASGVLAVFGAWSLRRSHPDAAHYFAALATMPLLVMWLARPFDLYPRFFSYALPVLLLFLTAGVSRWERRFCFVLAAAVIGVLLFSWRGAWQRPAEDEGYREVSRAVLQGADPGAAFCAIGGARLVWRYYIHAPIATPQSLAEVQDLGRTRPEVRFVYYPASWQDERQSEIARFLYGRAAWREVNGLVWFVYRNR